MPGHYGPTTLSLVSSAAMPDYVISTLKVMPTHLGLDQLDAALNRG
jgi:hypothetical protein